MTATVEPGGPGRPLPPAPAEGDFSTERRLIWISLVAVMVGLLCAVVATALAHLIGLFINLFYFGRWSAELRSPAGSPLGPFMAAVPVLGALVIGLLARYGSERIRGHGIPEAMEAILYGKSRMDLKVALLKPLSSAISIGSGGPFGAEGPIIMTGGAFGSLIAQLFRMSAAERKTLLVAGAAGGMSATFATPLAAIALAVELLLFEWKPRSFIPVALASITAAVVRPFLLGSGPLFPVPPHGPPSVSIVLGAVVVGLTAGLLAMFLTWAVYGTEDAFARLKLHWMWWPAIGGVVVGIGGLIEPRALGVGYDLIADLLAGRYVTQGLLLLVLVKATIWAVALGSGTSGGVLAPLLILGGSLGALEAGFLPGGSRTLWPLVATAAIMGGTMRSPLTGTLFALELTHDLNALLPVATACVVAHAFTVLYMRRSILTEKVARRGHHLSREYSVDPLDRLTVAEVMTTTLVTVPAALPVAELLRRLSSGELGGHQGYPLVDGAGRLVGVVTRKNLLDEWLAQVLRTTGSSELAPIISFDLVDREPVTITPLDSCRAAAERMALAGVGRLVVVAPGDARQPVGIITRSDLLESRRRVVDEEVRRERLVAWPWPRRPAGS